MNERPIIFLEGPDEVKKIGPLEIEWHHYYGPGFFWRGKNFVPRVNSPLWILSRWMYPDKFGKRK